MHSFCAEQLTAVVNSGTDHLDDQSAVCVLGHERLHSDHLFTKFAMLVQEEPSLE